MKFSRTSAVTNHPGICSDQYDNTHGEFYIDSLSSVEKDFSAKEKFYYQLKIKKRTKRLVCWNSP